MRRWMEKKKLSALTLLVMAALTVFFLYFELITGNGHSFLEGLIYMWPVVVFAVIFFAVLAAVWFYFFLSKSSSLESRELFGAAAYAVLAVSLLLTFVAWFYFRESQESKALQAFNAESRRIVSVVENRLKPYIDVLSGVQGLFAASQNVEEGEWLAYADKLQIGQKYPGMQALRYFEKDAIGAFTARYLFLAPHDSSYKISGPAAAGLILKTVDMARDTGSVVMTPQLELEGAYPAEGFLLIAPIYKNGLPLTTVEERRLALAGYIDAVCSSREFFSEMLQGIRNIELEVRDGDELMTAYEISSTLFDSGGNAERMNKKDRFTAAIPMSVAGRLWTIEFHASKNYGLGDVERKFSSAILFIGGLFSLLMFAILLVFSASRKQVVGMAKEMTRSIRNLAAIVEQSDDGIYSETLDGVVTSWNLGAEKMYGWTAGEMIGRSLKVIFPDSVKGEFSDILARIRKGDRLHHLETIRNTKDGRQLDVSLTVSPIRDAAGVVTGASVTARDITERKRLESQLLQAQKMEMIGTLAGGIAHDLNNQLTPVVGYIDLLEKQIQDAGSLELLHDAKEAAGRCVDVVERLMSFSRTSTTKISNLTPQKILDDVKKIITRVFPATIQIKFSCASDLWPVRGNETELQTVIMNLATNARDAMPSGGKITISAAQKGSVEVPFIRFTISDTGSGISAEVLQHIFEPFFTTKQKGRGTGLGLAMVFSIVKKFGGSIEVDSPPGHGASFHVDLPAYPGADVSQPEKKDISVMPRGSETVLFADDEENLRKLGRAFLERLGYKVLMASDGEEAVKIYREKMNEIAAVVMDITMPRLSGTQAFHQIRRLNPDAKVILASGYSAEGSAKDFIGEGASSFLPKPYTIQPLAQTLRRVLDLPSAGRP